MKLKLISIIILLLFSKEMYAHILPKELMHKGKPIEAICIKEVIEQQKNINLSEYVFPSNISVISTKAYDKNLIGYTYLYHENNITYECEVFYKYLGKINDKIAIFITYRDGGTGIFTRLALLKRDNDILSNFANITLEGDRCDAGVEMAYVKDNRLHYTLNIGSAHFPELCNTHGKNINIPHNINNLSYSAVGSCCAIAKFEDNEFKSIELTSSYLEINSEDQSLQNCFAIIYNQYLRKNHTSINITDLEKFMDEVFLLYNTHHPLYRE